MSFSSFLMISLEFSLYSIMSSANSDNFTSPFLIQIPFVYFSYLIDVAGTSFTTLKYVPSTGFPGGSDGKESACNAGDPGSIPELERFSGEGNGYPLQYSCLENPMNRVAWWATIHGIAELDMAERLTLIHYAPSTTTLLKVFIMNQR